MTDETKKDLENLRAALLRLRWEVKSREALGLVSEFLAAVDVELLAERVVSGD